MSQRTSLMKPASVLLGAFLCGYLSAHGRIGPPAGAAPADVHGSVGVAVTGFQTSAGSYVLWSDGHISNAATGLTVNPSPQTSGAYATPTVFVASTVPKTVVSGSPSVAVSTLPTTAATLVLFANGAILKPSDVGASAPSSKGNVRFVQGLGSTGAPVSSGDIAFGPPTVSSSVVVNFNPPFTDTPLVLGILAGGGGYASSVLSAGTIPQNVVPLVSTTSSATLSSTAPMYAATSPPFAWVIAIGN